MKIEELENAHFDASFALEQAAIDWALDHEPLLRQMAAGGCVESAQFIAAMDVYFEKFRVMDQVQTDVQFAEIVAGEEETV